MEEFAFNLGNEEIMTSATNFVEKYADFVENLPFDLQRYVTRLREIDCTYREMLVEIETLNESFVKEIDLSVSKKSTNILMRMQSLLGRCRELGDEKISILQQINESIENKKKTVEHSSHRFKTVYRPDQKSEFNGKRELNKLDYQKSSKRSRRHRPTYSDKHDKVKMTMVDSIAASSYSRFSIATSGSNDTTPTGDKPRASSSSDVSSNIKRPQMMLKVKDEPFSIRKSDKLVKKEASPDFSTSSGVSSGGSVASPPRPTSASTQKLSVSKTSSNKANLPTNKVTIPSNISNGSNKNSSKGKKKKKKSFKPSEKPLTRTPSPQPEYPIDPNEPTYCLCDQVSFGQMIGCDNKKCPIEWFHFSCVGLTHKPAKGKWFCPDCSRDMKDRKKDTKKEHR